MATRTKVRLKDAFYGVSVIRWQWTGLLNGDDGQPVSFPQFADKSVQVKGTFGVGGTVILEGSNDTVEETPTYGPLNDPQGDAISFTAAGVAQVLENTYLIRPRVTAGDGDTNLTVTLLIRR